MSSPKDNPEPLRVDLLVHSAAQVLTLAGGPQRGQEIGRLGLIEQGAVAIKGGEIIAVGASEALSARYRADQELDASGSVVLPGFVDPHTHLVWAGDRAEEFEMRLRGASYMEIMTAGGGIAATVAQTRAAAVPELHRSAHARLQRALAHGTTTMEAKSGYGLDTETELRTLQVMLALDDEGPVEIAPTFMGAHALPPEYHDQPDEYVQLVCETMLPAVHAWWLEHAGGRALPFVDVFCEPGAFDLRQSDRILSSALEYGFPLKIHADEFESIGGVGLAVRLGAISADHLVHTPKAEIEQLGMSDTVAVALPCTPFGLGEDRYTPAQALIESDAVLAIATDLNPGPAWCESMQFAIALACRYLRLTPAQAIAAATINAAAAIGREARIGSLEQGKQADLILLESADYRHLGYRFGSNLVSCVLKRGRMVFSRGMELMR